MRRSYARGESAVEELAVAGLNAPVAMRRHPAARRLTLRISHSNRGVVLTTPRDCDVADACRFVTKHIAWVNKHLSELPPAVAFSHGAVFPLRGDDMEIEFVGAARRGKVVWAEPAQTDFFSEAGSIPGDQTGQASAGRLCVAGQAAHAPRRLQDWLIQQARADLSEHVRWHARNLRLTPKRITVRDQTTRWGSCSSNGSLSFSWRLVLAPPNVLEYVAAHEVAHLQEMNHGPRFWALVRETMPGMEAPKKWLHDHGAILHSYGA